MERSVQVQSLRGGCTQAGFAVRSALATCDRAEGSPGAKSVLTETVGFPSNLYMLAALSSFFPSFEGAPSL